MSDIDLRSFLVLIVVPLVVVARRRTPPGNDCMAFILLGWPSAPPVNIAV
eukprot:COSAG01_NODE_64392_length_276_cov_1.728814_1_plen_49_part_10